MMWAKGTSKQNSEKNIGPKKEEETTQNIK
jgi:hypothetical protein